jgi:ADP-ribose pyrophosphatase
VPKDKWTVLESEPVLEHPYLQVTMQTVQLSDGQIVPSWPIVKARDYVNVMVLDGAGQVMIIEGYKHGLGRSSWQLLGGYLEPGEDPLAAARRELLEESGFKSEEWRHLGTFVVDANRYVGAGHFYLARNAHQAAEPNHDDLERFAVRWEPLSELKRALFDGRIAGLSYAVNASLGLLFLG